MTRKALAALLALPALSALAQTAAVTAPADSSARIAADAEWLSADALKGRKAGTAEADAAADRLAEEFRKNGILPGGEKGTYFQTFDFIDGVDLGPKNALATAGTAPVGRSWKLGTDFAPLTFSAPGELSGEVVFAGYGIASKELGYDDYAGLDVKGKVVLVLRYAPSGDDPKSDFAPYMALRYKAGIAREKGATALLVATGPNTKDVKDELVAARTDVAVSDAGLLAVSVKRDVAEALFQGSGKSLLDAQKAIDDAKKPGSFALTGARATGTVDLKARRAATRNVIGLLPGGDTAKNTEFVVVGAHYDHLGLGGPASLDPSPMGKIHHGADDNASGVAAMLELQRRLVLQRGTLGRSILFMAFGAEEIGLLGSSHFVKHPTVALDKVVAMVNLDMVGRMKNDKLDVHGAGTSPVLKPLFEAANKDLGLTLNLIQGGFGPSDHASFYGVQKPVVFAFTGNHADYHRPSDTADKLNVAGTVKVVRFLEPVIAGLSTAAERPPFTAVKESGGPGGSRSAGFRVYVGGIPDYSEEKNGVLLTGVTPDSPAEKAGMKGGDRIVKFGEKEIRDIYDYTYALQDRKPGEKVVVVVEREENGVKVKKSLDLTLGSRPSSGK